MLRMKRFAIACHVMFALILIAGVDAQITFGRAEDLGPILNTTANESSPCVTADGLELYFHSNRTGGSGGADIWVSRRATKNQPWGAPVNLGSVVNSPGNEIAPTLSPDGLELVFSDYGTPRSGGFGKTDLWVTKRASRSAPWGTPVNLGPLVNSAEDEITPSFSPSGLELYIDSYRPDGLGYSDLWVTRRDSKTAPWKAVELLGPNVNSAGVEHCPTFFPDGLTMLFDRTPPGLSSETGDLMMAQRTSVTSPWGPAMNLGRALSTHWASGISEDGATLYYTSRLPDGSSGNDLWRVPITIDPKGIALWQTVLSIFDTYAKAVNARDAELLCSLWDRFGVKMKENADPTAGIDAIKSLVTASMSRFESRAMTIETMEVEGFGDIIVARGTYTSRDKLKSATETTWYSGWFMSVFRRQPDGSWKIYRDAAGPMKPVSSS